MPYVLMILVIAGGGRPAIATHDFLTQQGCEHARTMFLEGAREAIAAGAGRLTVVAICAPAATLSNG